ncbi:MFS multidrug transporter [Aspergillus campestris IBT 28561]|uniref:MFS multidrug transporter n=1 Tax=Aspergillus campestris (strain IBT 28561) TaxID=1392248 RepID=A0A2I1CSU9_ASPC2|nr:MFS multidrug transporter [Aspergillus campestris IBT 28561]PKY00706.1 MFS multidrug transporter [Aspergillus campestris IBT 28561]
MEKSPPAVSSSSEESRDISLHNVLVAHGLGLAPDGSFVRWLEKNPRHPRNWSTPRKFYDLIVIHLCDFFVTVASSAGTAAAKAAHVEFGISQTMAIFCFVSVSLMGQVLGSLILSSYSETFGRKRLYVLSTAIFSIGCIIIPAVPSLAAVVIGRWVTGFVSSIPANVLTGSLEDMYNSQDRLWWMCMIAVASNLGLVLGPLFGVYITTDLGWRWLFYIMAIITGILAGLCMFIRESRPALVLAHEVALFRQTTGLDTPPPLNPDHSPDFRTFARTTLLRPIQLYTEPIVCCVALMNSTTFGLIYLFSDALLPIYENMGFAQPQASLPFIAMAIGVILSLGMRLVDRVIIRRRINSGRTLLPEHKLTGLCVGTPMLAISLWWFGWTIPPRIQGLHWMVPTLPLVLLGFALNEFLTVMLGYLADSYLCYAASGLAAVALLRGVFSAVFPLFAGHMFSSLGANVATSVLASLATVYCFIPPLFVRYGPQIRARSRFAKHSLRTHEATCIDKDQFVTVAN